MAVTYQLFTRYLNEKINRVITNRTKVEWYANDFDTNGDYDSYDVEIINQELEKSSQAETVEGINAVKETFIVSSEDPSPEEVSEYYSVITKESAMSNPKYDMLFLYDGLGIKGGDEEDSESKKDANLEIYYDKMFRVKLDPWFLHSQHASLLSVMNTGSKMANIFGVDGIKIGKVVPLEQYIDIR